MKKFIIIVILIIISFGGYVIYVETTKNKIPPLEVQLEKSEINKYFIYGTVLNIEGKLTLENIEFDEMDLVLYNQNLKLNKKDTIEKRFTSIPIEYNVNDKIVEFYTSDLINEGIYLDDKEIGEYSIFIRTAVKEIIDEEEQINYKYYVLDNKTEYKDTTYYTMNKYNKKIVINSENSYGTMMLNITENKDKIEVYDIVIDAGHGGMDPGAVVGEYQEKDFTLAISLELKEHLEKEGLKVKLTRDENSLNDDEYFNEYGKGGRAQISHEVYAKYLLSVHLNKNTSSKVSGIELYTPSNINYDFAKDLVKKIVDNTSIEYSNRKNFKMFDGIYTHNFTETEIEQSNQEAIAKGYNPYDITTSSSYLYMIRETGGIMTGAYVDSRNEKQDANDYYYANIGAEAYLLEMCYLSNSNDIALLQKEQTEYVEAISKAIISNFDK